MNILDASMTVLENRKQCCFGQPGPAAIVLHPEQYKELILAAQAPMKPLSLNDVPIWLCANVIGPAVVDQRGLLMLRMIGAYRP